VSDDAWVTPSDVPLLAVAGVLAGLAGSTAGLASLASYPALLLVGLPPLAANVTNTVSLTTAGIGAALGSGPELRGPRLMSWWLPLIAAVGGCCGAALLLVTPAEVFERIVPFLIGGASLLLLVQPRIRALHGEGLDARARVLLPLGLFPVAVYSGYFGAAAGVMMLALILVLTDEPLPRGNAAKNLLLWVANGIAALGFAVFADVEWLAAAPLAAGCLLGGALGPRVLRRLPEAPVRWFIAVAGLGLAVRLWFTA
jgi:uncharacterized membrane protein YfcA